MYRIKDFEDAMVQFTEYKLKLKKELLEEKITTEEYHKLLKLKLAELGL